MQDDKRRGDPGAHQTDDLDILRFIEAVLLGIFLFAGRFLRTMWDFLFRPAPFRSALQLRTDRPLGNLSANARYARPLSYLFVSVIAFLLTCPKAFRFAPGGSVLPASIEQLLNWFWKALSEFNTTDLVALFVPFALCVALYAYATHLAFKIFRRDARVADLLRINCYFVGSFLALTAAVCAPYLPLSGQQGERWQLAVGASLVLKFPLAMAVLLCIYRYVALLRSASQSGWLSTCAVAIGTFFAFGWLVTSLVIYWFLVEGAQL